MVNTSISAQNLAETLNLQRAMFNCTGLAIFATDSQGVLKEFNIGAQQMLGYSAEEVIDQVTSLIFYDTDELLNRLKKLTESASQPISSHELIYAKARTHLTDENEWTFIRKDGSCFPVLLSLTAITDEAGALTGFLEIAIDISKRIEVEKSLHIANSELAHLYQNVKREKLLVETILNNSPIAMLMVSANYHITLWNPSAEKLFGYTQEEAIGKYVYNLITTDTQERVGRSYIQRVFQGEAIQAITQRKRKDDTLVDVELFAVPIIMNDQEVAALVLYHNITELVTARKQAESANQAKSQFLANMSHEIRTPLNAIIGMSSLLLGTHLNVEQQEFAETIRTSSDALLAIINDILDFSKIEAGKLELEYSAFNLYKCLEDAMDLVSARASEKQLELIYSIDTSCPAHIVGDMARLRQVVVNLLSNAVKFTERGEIVVNVYSQIASDKEQAQFIKNWSAYIAHQPDQVITEACYRLEFTVKDTGIGIPPDRLNRLFHSFSQIDATMTRKYGGTGLGLAISKRLVDMMGGTMWVESQVAYGSAFSFTIITAPALVQTPIYIQHNQPELQQKRVLIVDDNSTNRRILMRQTRAWGMLPTVLASGIEALDWVRDGEIFDVGLLDMQMPGMDGATLARHIKTHCNIPLVLLSSLSNINEIRHILMQLFVASLTKPVKIEELHKTIVEVLGLPNIPSTTKRQPSNEYPSLFDPTMGQRIPLRILLAEDNHINQNVALHILKKLGYRADIAGDGREAVEAIQRQPYDVILMDVQMPEMDGVEATQYIRQVIPKPQQPFIVALTANALQGDRERYLGFGMDAYLSKPIEISTLIELLSQIKTNYITPVTRPTTVEFINPGLVDLTQLRQTLDDEPEIINEFIEKFFEESVKQLRDIEEAIALANGKQLKLRAHSLKSNCTLFGANKMAAICQELEDISLNKEFKIASNLLSELQAMYAKVNYALQAELMD